MAASEKPRATIDLSALQRAVEEMFEARAKPSEWRIRMRAEIDALRKLLGA